ncbi:MAG: hypothetical protein R2911_42595 [Caldilineaceae bacterium]
MSSETFAQSRSGNGSASVSTPVISPGIINFGTLAIGQSETRSLIFCDTVDDGALFEERDEITLSLSENSAWFYVVQCEQVSSEQPEQLRFTVQADTTNLLPGQSYDGWILIHGKQKQAKAVLTMQVASVSPIAKLIQSRIFQLPLLIAVILVALATSAGGSLSKAFIPWRSFAASDKVASLAVAAPLSNEDLVFAVSEERQLTLYFANPFASASQRSLDVPGWSPVWSPNGSQVAYISDSDGLVEQIYVLNVETGLIYQLSNNSGYKMMPKWSPDGLRLAYISGKPNQGTLQIVSVPNAQVELLGEAERTAILGETEKMAQVVQSVSSTQNQGGKALGYSRYFEWSPDGASILFDLYDGDDRRVYLATSNSLQMLIDSDIWSTPVWSPDGTEIIAASNIGIYVMDGNGGAPQKLNARPAYKPNWSRDGKKIAFLAGANRDAADALWVMDADGRNAVAVADVGVVAYAWSDTSDTLAYITGNPDSENPTLYLWVTQIGQAPRLVAEVSEPSVSWRTQGL